ncbi:basic proline-rich protein-like [Trachemys scripta elegans]|uniref:basic proline-rich protein-like n=1 Tax=Trachemys scripta elegans TaxID=31138 RepID=UPI0015578897|nr:basic proline-rich protein-like [Trachemys scripta elegans]
MSSALTVLLLGCWLAGHSGVWGGIAPGGPPPGNRHRRGQPGPSASPRGDPPAAPSGIQLLGWRTQPWLVMPQFPTLGRRLRPSPLKPPPRRFGPPTQEVPRPSLAPAPGKDTLSAIRPVLQVITH